MIDARYLDSDFGVQVEHRGHARNIKLRGEFDASTKKELEKELRDLPLTRLHEVTLDLRETTFVDSSGLRVILEYWSSAIRNAFELTILVPDGGQVRDAIEIAGLTNVLPIGPRPAG